MRKIKEVLRLQIGEGLSRRQVSAATALPYTTVADYLARARRAGLGWPLPEGLDDAALEARLFRRAAVPAAAARPLPDWAELDRELRSKRNVTLALLHLEYKEQHPEGYQYTQFCRHYHAWRGRVDLVMRQEHRAGEKCFVDWAGQTVPITDPATGEIAQAQIFVATLGASNFTYAEAFASQELAHWISGHIHAFEAWGGCPKICVPDNPRTGVSKAHRYEPILNPTYAEMAAHYGVAVIPARPYKPRDKAKVEVGVQVVQRWILARLRKRTFFSLAELNAAINELLAGLNRKPFKKLPGSRQSVFEAIDRPALRPLPATRYQFATWKHATVNIDYHVEVDHHYYSVPHQHVGEHCDVRLSEATVEIFRRGRRIASHLRSSVGGRSTTTSEHMPESHRRHLEWTPGRIVHWAEAAGPRTAALVQAILEGRPHPEQGYRSCLGIMRLGRRFGDARLEAACARALAIRGLSYRSVESILKTGLDAQPLPEPAPPLIPRAHENVRGPGYYR
ncbi:MAG TPA: IS21 family transposase [Candidatus Dormibacteraeota bacterium]|nr:IS21 family transposase [Candidatus Dormibacteraeota bacterium]